jgi:hypothetical protein
LTPNTAPTSRKIDGRRPEFLGAGTERNLDLAAGQVVSAAAERVVGEAAPVGQRVAVDVERDAEHARADAADVEAADLRLAKEEAVGQADRIDPGPASR